MTETATQLPHRVREYETIYVLRPEVTRENQERIANRVTEAVTRESGKLTALENWGRRQLAYAVTKYRRGVYIYLKYLGGGAAVAEVERNLRMLDDVLKYQTVQVRSEVEWEDVQVEPENLKFEAVEPATEEDLAEPIERLLGLEPAPERDHGPSDGDDGDEDDFMTDDSSRRGREGQES